MSSSRLVLGCLFVVLAACGSDDVPSEPNVDAQVDAPDLEPVGVGFTRHTISTDLPGPGWLATADLDGDGKLEVVVASLGLSEDSFQGSLTIYERGDSLGDWTATTLATDLGFANQPSIVDVDGDGDLDIIQPTGFFVCQFLQTPCGGVFWFEQRDTEWQRHAVIAGHDLFYHSVSLIDFDGDGKKDMVTVGESFAPPAQGSAELHVFRGIGEGEFASTPDVLGAGLGAFPRIHDIDGDGDLDVASAEFFHGDDSFAWLERKPEGQWKRHVIDADSGPSIQLTLVPNLYGDGKLRAIGTNHTNTERSQADPWESAVIAFEIPEDPTQPWPKQSISTGIVSRAGDLTMNRHDAPGIHGVGDIDGDGDLDIAVSGDGDPRVFWLEQTAPGQFTTHVLATELGQAGGMVVTDLDADGRPEIVVTGYEDRVVYIYERD